MWLGPDRQDFVVRRSVLACVDQENGADGQHS